MLIVLISFLSVKFFALLYNNLIILQLHSSAVLLSMGFNLNNNIVVINFCRADYCPYA